MKKDALLSYRVKGNSNENLKNNPLNNPNNSLYSFPPIELKGGVRKVR